MKPPKQAGSHGRQHYFQDRGHLQTPPKATTPTDLELELNEKSSLRIFVIRPISGLDWMQHVEVATSTCLAFSSSILSILVSQYKHTHTRVYAHLSLSATALLSSSAALLPVGTAGRGVGRKNRVKRARATAVFSFLWVKSSTHTHTRRKLLCMCVCRGDGLYLSACLYRKLKKRPATREFDSTKYTYTDSQAQT